MSKPTYKLLIVVAAPALWAPFRVRKIGRMERLIRRCCTIGGMGSLLPSHTTCDLNLPCGSFPKT